MDMQRKVYWLVMFLVSFCALFIVYNVNAREQTREEDDDLLLSWDLREQSGTADKARNILQRHGENDGELSHIKRSHQPSLKYNAIKVHSHHNVSKRSLEKASLIQASSRLQANEKVLRPHMTFEYPDYQTPTPFPEDVAIGTELLKVNVVNRPENSDLILSTSNESFLAKWNGGNSVLIITDRRLDADDNNGQYIFNMWAKIRGTDETASTTVRVTTLNTNDEPPRFTQSIYTSSVDEKAKPGAFVATVVATDKDRDKVKYSFASGLLQHKMFVIHEQDGVIKLVNNPREIDFEEDKYELNVRAVDDGSCCTGGDKVQHTGSTLVVVSIIDINDHKPEFKDCKEITAEVDENMPIGTFVIKMTATDDDRGMNKVLNYSIVMQPDQTESNFIIDVKDGSVNTNKVFDREAENGKVVSVTVKATDNGNPPLEGLCTFMVNIKDVNDNAPQFNRDSYQQTITPNQKPREDTLFWIAATDRDADRNAMIGYTLERKHNNNDLDYFAINPDSGRVTLKKHLSSQTNFNFYAVATDKGEPPLSSKVDVRVDVLRENALVPKWVTNTKEPISISESTPIGTLVATLEARASSRHWTLDRDPFDLSPPCRPQSGQRANWTLCTPDKTNLSGQQGGLRSNGSWSESPDNEKVTYRLLKGNSEQSNKNDVFLLSPSTKDGKDVALITLNKVLDYETIAEYNLAVEVLNVFQLASEATIYIRLTDVNDEVPLFNEIESAIVLENEPPGTRVVNIIAHDKDATPLFRKVTYTLTSGYENFKINPDTGEVTTLVVFNRENIPQYLIQVEATDGAPSARPGKNPGEHNTHRKDFWIQIGDINDNPPKFAQEVYRARVKENEDTNFIVTTVTAEDPDDTASLSYQLTGGNDQGAFDVIEDTGAIYVAGKIDYETKTRYDLILVVRDGLHEASTIVQVEVEDVNDMPPVFNQTTYEVTLVEEETINLPRKLVQVFAEDGDKDRPKNIIYFLSGQGTQGIGNKCFEINKATGEISVLRGLDRDLPYGRPVWRFTALASDEGGGPGSLTGFAEVIIDLTDINDNVPMFVEPFYKGYVKENQVKDVKVMVMSAVDYDDGPNAVLKYKILENAKFNGADVFAINPIDATITTAICCLDREKNDQYKIVVVASDIGIESGTGTATIIIEDVNDSPPRFDRDVYEISIPETNGNIVKFDEPVLSFKVLDDDLPETNKNYFLIEPKSGPGYDRFIIVPRDPDEGELKVKLPLDYENPEHRKGFHFRIIVDDSGGLSNDTERMATAEVKIQLIDINDNAPEFDNPYINVTVSEGETTGTRIAKFRATDRDQDGNSTVSYEIERATNRRRHFSILSDGTVIVQRPLDREREDGHIVHILAIDDGYPAKTSTATLAVTVSDINDNAPELCKRYEGLVTENSVGPFPERVLDRETNLPLVIEVCDSDDELLGNGFPFTITMDTSADESVVNTFQIQSEHIRTASVYVKRTLDREQKKRFKIPIRISDSGKPTQTGTSTLTVIVGDVNDRDMTDGKTDIMVYAFKGKTTTNEIIGRVYATDEDDWDWTDKTYSWSDRPSNFQLDESSGELTMLNSTREGVYTFTVNIHDSVKNQYAKSIVTVTVKAISEEAVMKSGSIRIKDMSEEEFIEKGNDGLSKRDLLRAKIVEILGTNDVEIFTVMNSNRPGMLDVRFAARGSPYYKPEKMNGLLNQHSSEIESELDIKLEMIGIDECLYEFYNCESSCSNELVIYDKPYKVSTKNTALVGIRAFVKHNCVCAARENFHSETMCKWNSCYNRGVCKVEHNGIKCKCESGFDGPRCQQTTRSFNGDGYAWFSPLALCENSHLSFEFITKDGDGLIFYNGPIAEPLSSELVQDFMSFELEGGKPRLLVDYGSGTAEIIVSKSKMLNDSEWHRIDISWEPELVTLTVDLCIDISANVYDGKSSVTERVRCEASGTPPGFNEFLNVNSPIQLGGVSHPTLEKYKWQYQYNPNRFNGCIKNFIHNSEMYDLGNPGKEWNTKSGCQQTEVACQENEIQPCNNGYCVGDLHGNAKCICHPGYMGKKCEKETIPSMFKNDSFVKYIFESNPNHQNEFKSEIQLRFRADLPNGELMHVQGIRHEYMLLEIRDKRLQFRYNLNEFDKLNEHTVYLSSFQANDGYWHTVNVVRYGASASLSVDGGGGKLFNETFNYNDIHQLITVPKDGIVLGGRKDSLSGEVPDYENGCMDDVRFDRITQHLPMPPAEFRSDYAEVFNYSHVESGCDPQACLHVKCPENMYCEDLFFNHDCRCSVGFIMNKMGLCVDIDECEDIHICENGGTCNNLLGGFLCHCPPTHTGKFCEVFQEKHEVKLSMGALAAILASFFAILILVLLLIVYTRQRRTNYGLVDPDEDIRETIINYNDEGGGEDDMHTYDIGPLRIPVDASGMPISAKPGPEKPYKEPMQNRAYSPDEPNVGEFISSNLGKADDDPESLPLDDLRVYAYEGGGSDAGSLSSLASGTDDNEQDFDYLNGWGPRFQKLADMYGQGESEEE
uniref:Neural-cadherin n=1 Tax=Strigamia maritima TaxID=126957 RepID=T1ILH8_STRMM